VRVLNRPSLGANILDEFGAVILVWNSGPFGRFARIYIEIRESEKVGKPRISFSEMLPHWYVKAQPSRKQLMLDCSADV
jgi:hypothetical protein